MEYQDQGKSLLTPTAPHKVPRKPVPIKSPNKGISGLGFESVNWGSSEYAYQPVENADSLENAEERVSYPTPLSTPLPQPHPKSLVDRLGIFAGGWRGGCIYCAITTAIVLLINACLTISAFVKYGAEDGVGTIFKGGCDEAKKLSLVAHLLINALGTILLSASNYTMQCLSAPTRIEVDKAHARRKWLDIGIPSVKNLGRISKVRLTLWLLLGLSSVPLHFIYNSAVFSTVATYDYMTRAIIESRIPSNASNYERLDKKGCIEAYGRQFTSDRRDVFLVVSGDGTVEVDAEHGIYMGGPDPFTWICEYLGTPYPPCIISDAVAVADSWMVNGTTVEYCLSEKMPEVCSLQYSLHIMIVVIICNFVKAASMLLTVFKSKDEPLVTVGDAIASFLSAPDEMTRGMCIVSKREIKKVWRPIEAGNSQSVWKPHRSTWFHAASPSRWVICNVLSLGTIAFVTFLLPIIYSSMDSSSVPRDITSLWKLGFGTIDIRLVSPPSFNQSATYRGLIACVLTANLPQAVFSFLYLLYNSIFTCMLLGDEWDRFSHQRRTLRVTRPVGDQRSTYFLQLPYKYSIPLMVASGFMHWLISQSIFLVRVTSIRTEHLYRGTQYQPEATATESVIGYSPISIIASITLGGVMLAVAVANGFRRYGGGIPLVGNCSAAISASCHPDPCELSIATLPVMWGVIKREGDVGHCTFSSKEVGTPVPGQPYAGGTSGRELIGMGDGTTRGRRW